MLFWISLLVGLNFIVHLIVESLNLTYVGRPMPEEFASIWDEEKYRRSQEYLKTNTIFDLVTSFIASSLLILFLYFGLPLIDSYVRSFGFGEVGTGVFFFALLIVGVTLFSLPFSAYKTFVIEERFGFNRTTVGTFFKDFALQLALSLIIYSVLLSAILFIFTSWGPNAWIFCYALFSVVALFLYYITPIWLLPLFNKFSPLPDSELKSAIKDYIHKQKFSLEEVYSIDGSKRSNKMNAYCTGLGKTRRVALFDTLIENYSIGEIVAIVAHEVGHSKRHHLEISLITILLIYGLLFFLFSLFVQYTSSYYMGAFLFLVAFSSISWIPSVLQMALSRKHEYEADAFAKETAEGKDLVSALLKLSKDNLSNLTPHPVKVLFSYSHPPVIDRIKAL